MPENFISIEFYFVSWMFAHTHNDKQTYILSVCHRKKNTGILMLFKQPIKLRYIANRPSRSIFRELLTTLVAKKH